MRSSGKGMLLKFFLYQVPFFVVAAAILSIIYFLEMGTRVENALLTIALIIIASTPYLSLYVLRRKYKSMIKRGGRDIN